MIYENNLDLEVSFLFEHPIQKKKVRNGVYAYKFLNGTININGQKYIFYSMTEAISRFRKQYPAYKH